MLLFPCLALLASAQTCARRVLWYGDFDSMHLLGWRVEEGANTTVLLEPEYPWEADVHSEGTVLYDPAANEGAGEYRAYYVSQPGDAANQILGRMLTVATSADGLTNWSRPLFPFVPYQNYSHTNILLRMNGAAEVSQVSVFLNSNSSNSSSSSSSSNVVRRYEMFFLAKDVPPAFTDDPARFPPSVTAPCAAARPVSAAYGGVECTYRMASDDGFAWEPLEVVGNINAGSSGSFVYRGGGGSYSAFIQLGLPAPPGAFVPWDVGAGHARMIARAVSNVSSASDVRRGDASAGGGRSGGAGTWSPPAFVAQADWRDGQGDQLVGLYASDTDGDDDDDDDGQSNGSGGGGGHSGSGSERFAACSFGGRRVQVGVLGLFHALDQTIDNQLALSADGGQSWWRPARRPNVPLRPLGEWGSGLIWPFRALVTDAADAATLHMYVPARSP